MSVNIITTLKESGLTGNEARVYMYILEQGQATPPQIAKGVGLQRTNVYHIVRSLKENKLIDEQKRGKRKVYIAVDPYALISSIERQKASVEGLLPDLRSLYKAQKNKPVITFFEGYEQINRLIFEMIASANEKIYFIGSTRKLMDLSESDFKRYEQAIWDKKVFLHDILTSESAQETVKGSQERMKGYYRAFVLPEEYPDIPTSIIISRESIALLSLEDPIFGTRLVHKQIAQSFEALATLAQIVSREIS